MPMVNKIIFEIFRGDATGAQPRRGDCHPRNRGKNGLAFLSFCLEELGQGWARARLVDARGPARNSRAPWPENCQSGRPAWGPLFQGRFAELEAEGRCRWSAALTSIDRALHVGPLGRQTMTTTSCYAASAATSLLQAPSRRPALAEQAALAAIAIAQRQDARSFGLLSALKLRNSTNPPPARSTPTTSSRPRWKAFRRRRRCRTSPRAGSARRARRDRLREGRGGGARAQAEIADQLRPGDGRSKGYAAEETKAVLAQTEGLRP